MTPVMREQDYARQLSIITPDQAQRPVTIVGAGGIGSMTTLVLAKVGIGPLYVYDPDTVEIENVPSQLFGPESVGKQKVDALQQIVRQLTGEEIVPIATTWIGDIPTSIILLCVDSMAVRREIFEAISTRPSFEWMVDARMGGEVLRIEIVHLTDEAQQQDYRETLYSDEEAVQEACTAKAVAYNTFVIAGLVGAIVKTIIVNKAVPVEIIADLATQGFVTSRGTVRGTSGS